MRFSNWIKSVLGGSIQQLTPNQPDDGSDLDPDNPFPDPITIEITDVFDLHTIRPRDVKRVAEEYLLQAHEKGFRSVRIVHGKGLRSGHRGPVLKGTVSSVLRRVRPVLAYVSARQVDGGTGALYVLLATWPVNPTRP